MFKHILSFLIIVVLLVGCKSKSEDCIAPAIDKNLIGTWKAVVTEDGDVSGDIADIHIGECKQVYVKLNSISGGIPQMSNDWCRNVIARMMGTGNTDAIRNLGEVLFEVIEERRKTYTRSVMGVHKTEKLICIAKIN